MKSTIAQKRMRVLCRCIMAAFLLVLAHQPLQAEFHYVIITNSGGNDFSFFDVTNDSAPNVRYAVFPTLLQAPPRSL